MDAKRIPTSARTPAARGLERLFGDEGRLSGRTLVSMAAVIVLAAALLATAHLRLVTTAHERSLFIAGLRARMKLGTHRIVVVPNSDGSERRLLPEEAISVTAQSYDIVAERLEYAGYTFAGGVFLAFVVVILVARRFGTEGVEAFVRGRKLVSSRQAVRELRRRKRVGRYTLAGVPLQPDLERKHLLIVGTTGSGKTLAAKELLSQIRSYGERALVFDPEGEFCKDFRRPGDVILNPFDESMPPWNIWDEIEEGKDYQLVGFAEALFPPNPREPFFDEAAAVVFEDLVKRLRDHGEASNRKFLELAARSDILTLYEYLMGTPAARHVDPAGEKKSDSILSSFVNRVRVWEHLPESWRGEGFSIRKFVKDPERKGWIFVTSTEEQLPVVRRLLTLWTAIWVEALLSLPKNDGRIWTVLDELPALNKIRVPDLLTRGRKHGGCCVIGFQDLSQLEQVYGVPMARTIRSSCNTWLVFRPGDQATAEEVSKELGSQEISEVAESVGTGGHRNVSVHRRRVMRRLVLDAELMCLPDLQGYLRQPDLPVTRVGLKWKDWSRERAANDGGALEEVVGPRQSPPDVAATLGL